MTQSPPHSHFTAAAVCPPDERVSASQHRARVKSAEKRHQENIQDDFAAIDARMNMTPGQMISDTRVQNGLPPLDVAARMAEFNQCEAEAAAKGQSTWHMRHKEKMKTRKPMVDPPNIPAPKAYGNRGALMGQHDTRVRQNEDRSFEEPKMGGRKGKRKVVRFEDQLVESPPLESSPIPASSYSSPVESSIIPAFKMQSGKGKEVSRLFDEDEDGFSPLDYHFPEKDASEYSQHNSMTRSNHVKAIANSMVKDLSSLNDYFPDEDALEYPKHDRTTRSMKGKEVANSMDKDLSSLNEYFPEDALEYPKHNRTTRSMKGNEVANSMDKDLSSLNEYFPDEDALEYPKHNRTTRSMKGKEVAKLFDENVTSMVDYLPGGDSPEDSKKTRSKKGKEVAKSIVSKSIDEDLMSMVDDLPERPKRPTRSQKAIPNYTGEQIMSSSLISSSPELSKRPNKKVSAYWIGEKADQEAVTDDHPETVEPKSKRREVSDDLVLSPPPKRAYNKISVSYNGKKTTKEVIPTYSSLYDQPMPFAASNSAMVEKSSAMTMSGNLTGFMGFRGAASLGPSYSSGSALRNNHPEIGFKGAASFGPSYSSGSSMRNNHPEIAQPNSKKRKYVPGEFGLPVAAGPPAKKRDYKEVSENWNNLDKKTAKEAIPSSSFYGQPKPSAASSSAMVEKSSANTMPKHPTASPGVKGTKRVDSSSSGSSLSSIVFSDGDFEDREIGRTLRSARK